MNARIRIILLTIAALLSFGTTLAVASDLGQLIENQRLADFSVECLYENESGDVMGARWRHMPSGFVLDILRIQSVPQAFMWVNSPPVTDQGEPHTLEHLLLGKGTKGRYVASLEDMSLGSSSAYTQQVRTCYHYHTTAGVDVFFNLFEAKLDAMLTPNFSDEEIRREVCNMGITVDPVDSTLSLEEKGTVYNEMVSSFERPWSPVFFEIDRLLYGSTHPLAMSSGGYPDNIRTMQPDDIRRFHASTHHLNNMGAVVAISDEIPLEEIMTRFSEIFKRVEPDATPAGHPEDAFKKMPEPVTATFGQLIQVPFPHQNASEPGGMLFAWPPVLTMDSHEEIMLDLFLGNLTSGQTSNLYRKFIDSQTRLIDLGANAAWGWHSNTLGHPIYIGISNVKSEVSTETMMDSIRTLIMAEIESIAGYADGSPELEEFNQRALNRIIEQRRDTRDFLNSPPRFGYRGGTAPWMEHLFMLHKKGGFRRSLASVDELTFARESIEGKTNIWRDYVAKWKLLANKPFGVVGLPDPEFVARTEEARSDRVDKFVLDLQDRLGVDNADEAIVKYQAEYAVNTAAIDKEAATIEMPDFISDPPMTLDDPLRYTVVQLPGGVDHVASQFDAMTSANVGVAFNLKVVPESHLLYLAALPTLIRSVGVVKDGQTIPFDEMDERLRREILGLNAYFDINNRTERTELIVRGSGSDLDETLKAMEWIQAILFDASLTEDNLPRIRDAIDQSLAGLRNRMRGSEESWVNDPANAFWKQSNPLIMTTGSFLTRTHAYHRLRWQLKTLPDRRSVETFGTFLDNLAAYATDRDREQLTAIIEVLSGTSQDQTDVQAQTDAAITELANMKNSLSMADQELADEVLADLGKTMSDLPDETLSDDWTYLCREMKHDLFMAPADALTSMKELLDIVLRKDNVRSFATGNKPSLEAIKPKLTALVDKLGDAPSKAATHSKASSIVQRMAERYDGLTDPDYIALVNNNTRSGVHINTVDCASFVDSDEATLLRFLAARLYGGGGAHSMFMKTWGAGLAYSNGLRSNENSGRLIYYAERCPDLAQTMQFVVNELKKAPYDTSLADYAVAQAFAIIRSGNRYESRGEAMAADLADGLTPDIVANFRKGVLKLKAEGNLFEKLNKIMPDVYGEVLPGYGPSASSSEGVINFVIGPDKQLENYQEYLKSVESDAVLYRLYPRDYWLVKQK